MTKTLDLKLNKIRNQGASSGEFILADAKDADMGGGLSAPGWVYGVEGLPERRRTLAEYRELMRAVIRQGVVDIVLMSASSYERLGLEERLFDGSSVTPAVRANDSTDIHLIRGSRYAAFPSMPFRSMTIEQIQCGRAMCAPEERARGTDLGLYSVTFNNDPERDLRTLEAYREFRLEAEQKGFRHFLEVFDPNVPGAVEPDKLGDFVNDHIARLLAGVPRAGRPLFLKVAYHGPRFMEELASYDPELVPGILGGASGTTYDAFKLLAEARKYGARAALFGRRINNAEDQQTFIQFLRWIADGEMSPEEAVPGYHAALLQKGLRPRRSLSEDMQLVSFRVS